MSDLKFPQLNSLIISGRMTADPEVKLVGQDNKAVCNATIAADSGWGDKKKPIFLDCTFWGKTAEAAGKLKKGSPVVVEGRIEMDEWNDKQTGTKRNKIVVVANRIHGLAWETETPKDNPRESGEEVPF